MDIHMYVCSDGIFMTYGDSAGNTVEEKSGVFSLIQMNWLPSARGYRW